MALQLEEVRAQQEKPTKVSADLRKLHKDFVAHLKTKGGTGDFKPEKSDLRVVNDLVLIEAIASLDGNVLKQDLNNLGGVRVEAVNFIVSGYVPISAIPAIEALDSLQWMRVSYPVTRAGLVTSQGDSATRANTARAVYGVNGSGVTIGTMSGSYNCLNGAATDVVNNDLPPGITGLEKSLHVLAHSQMMKAEQ